MNKFSERFERGRERKLISLWERSLVDLSLVALLDWDEGKDLVLYAARDGYFYVYAMQRDPDAYEDDIYDFSDYDSAMDFFNRESSAPVQPDWEAQARYDEIHGTINGEDARIVEYRELVGEG